MANIIGTYMTESQSINRPPHFSGSNYWKARIRIFIQANDYSCWNIIENGCIIPTKITEKGEISKSQNEWTPLDTKDVQNNAKVIYTLYYALKVTHAETSQVKESKISILVHKYELFKIKINKIIF